MCTRRLVCTCTVVVLCLLVFVVAHTGAERSHRQMRRELLYALSAASGISRQTQSVLTDVINNSEALDSELLRRLGLQIITRDEDTTWSWFWSGRRRHAWLVGTPVEEVVFDSGQRTLQQRNVRVVVFQSSGMLVGATICVLDGDCNVLTWYAIDNPIGHISAVSLLSANNEIELVIDWDRLYGFRTDSARHNTSTRYRVLTKNGCDVTVRGVSKT
jgi:hypothetical protein